jgi:DNA polymerase-3 subunit alpha
MNTRTLRLYLPRTEDYDADVARMMQIDTLLRDSSGEDAVRIYVPNGVGIVVLESHHTVQANPALLESLQTMLGPEAVAVVA